MKKKAIILLSGGLDSCVVLALALSQKRDLLALSFNYGQRHQIELKFAQQIAKYYDICHTIIRIDSNLVDQAPSSLIDYTQPVQGPPAQNTIPDTYVPGRNLLFLAHAATYAEIHQCNEIHFGSNADDCDNYPDCRKEFLHSSEKAICMGASTPIRIQSPLIYLTKSEVIQLAQKLAVPLHLTWSCYNPTEDIPCGRCAACILRNS